MLKKFIAGVSLLVAATAVNAGVINLSEEVTVERTEFSKVVSFDKFDDMGGTRVLESVIVSITSLVEGSVSIENLGNRAETISTQLSASIDLVGPLGRLLSTTVPSVARVFNASAFDGSIDFGGTSGATFSDLGSSEFDTVTLMDAASLAFFSGMGTADFDFIADAASRASGSGNLVSSFRTSAGGTVSIQYVFSDGAISVPEPAFIALLGALMVVAGRIKRS